MVTLPTTKVPPAVVDPRVLVLYSKPKIGKTTILANLESNLILDFEGGTDMISATKVSIVGLKRYNWEPKETEEALNARHEQGKYFLTEIIRALRDQLAKTGKPPYLFISLDTITRLEELCELEATDMYMNSPQGKNYNRWSEKDEQEDPKHKTAGNYKPFAQWEMVTKLPKGYGYQWLRESYEKWINYLKPLCEHLILVGHLRLVTLVKKEGQEVDQKDLDLTGKIKAMTTSKFADAIGYVYREGANNYISFIPTDDVSCGSRAEHLEGQNLLISTKKDDKTVEVYWHNIFKRLVVK